MGLQAGGPRAGGACNFGYNALRWGIRAFTIANTLPPMRTSKILPLAALFMGLSLAGCRKAEDAAPAPSTPAPAVVAFDAPLTAQELAVLESMTDSVIGLEDMVLENGASVLEVIQEFDPDWLADAPYQGRGLRDQSDLPASDQRLLVIAKMLAVGEYLVNNANHVYPADGADAPAQEGLAYGFGSKQYWTRTRPVAPLAPNEDSSCMPDPGCTDQQVYGLDCSGMVYWMAYFAGLRFSVSEFGANATYFGTPANWTTAMTAPGSDNYDEINVFQLVEPIPVNDMRAGDIIKWPGHIGVVVGLGGSRWLFQSNGTGYRCPDPPGGNGGCQNNFKPTKRGPRMLKMTQDQIDQFGSNYIVLRISGNPCPPIMEDIDGNVYPTVLIGEQCWCAENLRTTRYHNGDAITNAASTAAWLDVGANEEGARSNASFGFFYNWYAVSDPRNVCPAGWHVPTDEEWTELVMFLDPLAEPDSDNQSQVAGGMLKSTGTIQDGTGAWNQPNVGATNESGFTGQPSGDRDLFGGVFEPTGFGYWWSSTSSGNETAWARNLSFANARVFRVGDDSGNKRSGYSVRCIKD